MWKLTVSDLFREPIKCLPKASIYTSIVNRIPLKGEPLTGLRSSPLFRRWAPRITLPSLSTFISQWPFSFSPSFSHSAPSLSNSLFISLLVGASASPYCSYAILRPFFPLKASLLSLSLNLSPNPMCPLG